jgi:hypothetical protein
MNIIPLVLLSLGLLAAKTDEAKSFRIELAQAIVDAGATPHEGRLLMSIARWESGYRRDVANCTVNGDAGRSVGPFQIQTRSAKERECICGSLVCAAQVAVKRIRESYALCSYLPEQEKLSAYCSGGCSGRKAKAMARTRWVP